MDYDICDMRLINLNSANAEKINGSFCSDVKFNFKNVLQESIDTDYVTIGVLNAQIPVSFYTINYTNDTLVFVYGSTTYNVQLTRGNYNSNSLIQELTAKLLLIGFNMTIVTSKITGVMTFSSTINFSFLGTSSIFPIIGFIPGTNYNSTSLSLTAIYPLNLLGIKRLKVSSIMMATNTYDSNNLGVNSTIASIPVNVPSFGLIDYVNNSNAYPLLMAKSLSNIDVQIYDEGNNLINFNGIDWTITIQITIYKKVQKINPETIFSNISNVLEDIKDELNQDNNTDDNKDTDNSVADNENNENDDSVDNSNPTNYTLDPELELLLNN